MLPLLPVNANFSWVTATTPDGTRLTTTVEKGGEVVEAEVRGSARPPQRFLGGAAGLSSSTRSLARLTG